MSRAKAMNGGKDWWQFIGDTWLEWWCWWSVCKTKNFMLCFGWFLTSLGDEKGKGWKVV